MSYTPTLTVQQVIDQLGQVTDKSRQVWVAGCDCNGAAGSVAASGDSDSYVVIERIAYVDDDED